METSELNLSCENIGVCLRNQDNNSEMDNDNRLEMYITPFNDGTSDSLNDSDTGCVFNSHIPQTGSAGLLSTKMTNSPNVNHFKNSFKTKNLFCNSSKLLYNKIRKQPKTVSGICNQSTSELPSFNNFPISLVMTPPTFEFMEIRLPLLHTFTDSTRSITHTVIDEHGLLEGQQFKYKQPLSDIDIIICPANDTLLEKLKHSLTSEEFQFKIREHCYGNDLTVKEKDENLYEMAEKECSLLCATDNIKQDIIIQNQDAVDNLMKKRNDFCGEHFYTLPPGKLLIGRSSSGEWLISCPQPKKTVKFKDTKIPKWPRKENIPQEKLYLDSLQNIEKEKTKAALGTNSESHQKDPSSSSYICIENLSCMTKENLSCYKESVVKESTDKTKNNQQTIKQENTTDTIDTSIQPIPVMMVCKEGDSLKVIQVPVKIENQLVEENISFHSNTCESIESEGTIKVKVEPVDTGYDTGQICMYGKDIQDENSPLNVRVPNLKQCGIHGHDESKHTSNSAESKVGHKRKSPEDDHQYIKKCISVPLQTDLIAFNSSHSEEKACSSLLEDNYSGSGAEDSETSRSGQEYSGISFPVMNDRETDALMDIETTRGTKRQARWGVKMFKEWLKQREFDPNFEDLSIKVLDERLEKFYAELRTADGKLYAANSFRGIRASINRHLTTNPYNRSLSLFTDHDFHESNMVFKVMMRKIKMEVVKKELPPPISGEDMTKLTRSPVLTINTPKGLQNKVWLDLTLNFTYKNCLKQRDYRTHMFVFKTDDNGMEYVEIKDPNRQPGEVSPKMVATRDIYCPVVSLMKYLTKRNKASEDFFQQPRCPKSMTDDSWYTSRPLGERQLANMMKIISKEAGLSRVYSNIVLKETILNSLLYMPMKPEKV
ncbi:uncharacterized protein LOC143062854 [Mytilus galloprovincialis]|uniref:uncharacterized protein LOC143062854 n=1 Tax=Mytilus galloprovincialis TaxID=29158 RepID=UPI003F7BEE52